jgi:glycosyltransferase involved in cell wall biosynthesis
MHADWLLQFDRKLIAKRLALADAIIGVSDYVTRGIRRVFPEFAHRCFTVFNGCDVAQIKPNPARHGSRCLSRIVFVGRLSPEKGLHVLIDAFRRVVKSRPDACLEIIGPEGMAPQSFIIGLSTDPLVRGLNRFYDGQSYSERLREHSKGKLLGNLVFLGFLTREEMIQRLRQADLFVQPSIASEMFGMAVTDAMAAGLPVVATRICGLPEVVAHEASGLLVPPDNPEVLAEAIIRLLNDSQLSEEMGRAGRSRVERMFSWEVVVESLSALYNGLIFGSPLTTPSTSPGIAE